MSNAYEFRLEPIKCVNCIHFEDRGLRTDYFYNGKKRPLRKVETRFYCKFFKEYLTTFYQNCTAYKGVRK